MAKGREPGAVLTLDLTWALAKAWYHNRLSPTFRRRTLDEAQSLFDELGLTGDFWRLAPYSRGAGVTATPVDNEPGSAGEGGYYPKTS